MTAYIGTSKAVKDAYGNWTTGGGGSGSVTDIDVYQPEQWGAFRQLQSGQAYSDDIINRYLQSYVNPTYERAAIESIARARNAYGPSASNYFSAATLAAQNKAASEAAYQQGATQAQALLNWADLRNKMMAQMLEQRPVEKIYEPAASSYSGFGGSSSSKSNIVMPMPTDIFAEWDALRASNEAMRRREEEDMWR